MLGLQPWGWAGQAVGQGGRGRSPGNCLEDFPFFLILALPDWRLALAQEDRQQGLEACPVFPPSSPPRLPPHRSIHAHCEMVKQDRKI